MIIDISFLFAVFIMTSIGYYGLLGLVWLLSYKRQAQVQVESNLCYTLLIPCANEEAVIGRTLRQLANLNYPKHQLELVVINDGSRDHTRDRVMQMAQQEHEVVVHLVDVPSELAQQGKGGALNQGYQYCLEQSDFRHLVETGRWIMGIFDADGRPDEDLLAIASRELADPKVGALNSSIRIRNRDQSLLARLQDIEFFVIARWLNGLRSYLFKTAFLGGNGQFMRVSFLSKLGSEPWNTWALTEDLDIGLDLLARTGCQTKHMTNAFVHQEGHQQLLRWFNQRVRWSWGSLQCLFYHVLGLRVFRTLFLSTIAKLEIVIALINPLISIILIPFSLCLIALNLASLAHIYFPIAIVTAWSVPSGWIVLILLLMFTSREYRTWRSLFWFGATIAYVFLQLIPLYVGFFKLATCQRPAWFKSQRVEVASAMSSWSNHSQNSLSRLSRSSRQSLSEHSVRSALEQTLRRNSRVLISAQDLIIQTLSPQNLLSPHESIRTPESTSSTHESGTPEVLPVVEPLDQYLVWIEPMNGACGDQWLYRARKQLEP